MRDYYNEILENGYKIKDKKDHLFELYQYENEKTGEDYILYRTDKNDKNYAKYAQLHIDALKKADTQAEKEKITMEKLQQELDLTKQALDELMMLSVGGGI